MRADAGDERGVSRNLANSYPAFVMWITETWPRSLPILCTLPLSDQRANASAEGTFEAFSRVIGMILECRRKSPPRPLTLLRPRPRMVRISHHCFLDNKDTITAVGRTTLLHFRQSFECIDPDSSAQTDSSGRCHVPSIFAHGVISCLETFSVGSGVDSAFRRSNRQHIVRRNNAIGPVWNSSNRAT